MHNPESYFLDASNAKKDITEQHDEFYQSIDKAFEFLEQKVASGHCDYYGISSNRFALNQQLPDSVALSTILERAKKLNAKHFKVIQCPFNVLESDLACSENGQASVMQLAQQSGIGVLGNRPLNALWNNQLERLVDVQHYDCLSRLEIEDLIGAGIDFEATLLESLDQPELESLKQYLVFFKQLGEFFVDRIPLFVFKDVVDQRWLPAVEQYMSLIGSLTISPDLEGQFERYFSHFNTVVKHMFEFYADTHQYHIQFIKQGLTALDASLSSDLSLQRLCLRAYRSTSGISSTLMGIDRKYT